MQRATQETWRPRGRVPCPRWLIRLTAIILLLSLQSTATAEEGRDTGSYEHASTNHCDRTTQLPRFATARLGTIRLRPSTLSSRIAFTADGSTLISSGPDISGGTILEFWDVSSGRLQDSIRVDQQVSIPGFDTRHFAIGPDGVLAVLRSNDVFSCNIRQPDKGSIWPRPGRPIAGVALSPDGKLLALAVGATSASSGGVLIYDRASRQQVRHIEMRSAPQSLQFALDSAGIATINEEGQVELWASRSGKRLRTIDADDTANIAFSPDGTFLATAGQSGPIRVWSISTGKPVCRIDIPTGEVCDFAYTPKGTSIAAILRYNHSGPDGVPAVTAWEDPNLLLWDANTGKRMRSHRTPYGDDTLAFSCDGALLATAGGGRSISLMSFPSLEPSLDLKGHARAVHFVKLFADGKSALTCGHDGKILMWNVGQGLPVWDAPLNGHATLAAVSPDCKQLAVGIFGRGLEVWDLIERRRIGLVRTDSARLPTALAFSPEGQRLACGDFRGRVAVFDSKTGKPIRTWGDQRGNDETGAEIQSLAWLPDGQTIVVADGFAMWWLNITPGSVDHDLQLSSEYQSRQLCLAPSGTLLADLTPDTCIVRRPADGFEVAKLDCPLSSTMAFSPNSGLLAIGRHGSSRSPEIVFFDVVSKKHNAVTLAGADTITSLAFSADGRLLASGGTDTAVLVWDVGRLVVEAKEPSRGVRPTMGNR